MSLRSPIFTTSRLSPRPSPSISSRSPTLKTARKSPSSKTTPRKIVDEKKFSKFQGMNTQELRARKAECVKTMDFDEAELIEEYMQISNVDNSCKLVEAYERWLLEGINQVIENYETQVAEIESQSRDREIKIRTQADTAFRQAQKAHIDELTQLEIERKVELLKVERRDTAEYTQLNNQAKRLAAANDFKSAREVQAKAEAKKEALINEGSESVNKKYDTLARQTCARQKGELDILQENLNQLLIKADARKSEDLRTQQLMVAVYIQSSLQKAVTEACAKTDAKDKKKKIAQTLTSYVSQELKARDKLFLLEVV